MSPSFRLGRIAGIEIGVHYTWLFAFALIAWSLAEGFFPSSFPGWSPVAYWATGVAAALLLFVSVLVHELAHSFVAKAKGLPVQGITLFIFGGVSNIGGEAARPKDEFAIAIVGPLTSLVLSGLFWALGWALPDQDGPLAATLSYLFLINLLLAGFNLLPGFPLDGGRVLRSILWGTTGSLARATRIAASVGQAFGWLLIAFGVFQVLERNYLSGLWIAFIGWFLNSAADSSRREVMLQEQFRGVRVGQVMDPNTETVTPQITVEELVHEWFLQRRRRAYPVSEDGKLAGIVTLTDVKGVPQDRWSQVRVAEIMRREPLYTVGADDDLDAALQLLAQHDLNQVPVLQEGRLVGLLSRAEVIRYLQFRHELGIRTERPR
ncbi:MAG: site-2 protease family protein [Chloroflexota bacterium]